MLDDAMRCSDRRMVMGEVRLLKAENERLRSALGFYADPENWGDFDYRYDRGEDEYPVYIPGEVDSDGGERAREALKGGAG